MDRSIIDRYHDALDSFVGLRNVDISTINRDTIFGMNAVVARGDRDVATADRYGIVRVDRIVGRIDRDRSVFYGDVRVALNALGTYIRPQRRGVAAAGGDIDGAAGDENLCLALNAIGSRIDRNRATVDGHNRGGTVIAGSADAGIGGSNINRRVVDRDNGALDALVARRDIDVSAGDRYRGIGTDGVVVGFQGDVAAGDRYGSIGADSIVRRIHIDRNRIDGTFFDGDARAGLEALVVRGYGNVAATNGKRCFRLNSVRVGRDVDRSALNGHVSLGVILAIIGLDAIAARVHGDRPV